MDVDTDFSGDPEFCKLLARRQDVDLVQASLELARDVQPKLDFGHTLEWISKRADEVRSHIHRVRSDRDMLKELVRCLAGTHGLHGDKFAREEMGRPLVRLGTSRRSIAIPHLHLRLQCNDHVE